MPAPTSTAELIDLVRKSGLYEGDSFDNRLGDLPRLPEQPTSTATLLVKHGLITKFQAKLLLLGKYRGFRIGPYTIKEQIGQGGMGAVYLAEHVTLLRKVALKVLTPGADTDTKLAVERFLREARSAAALDHPNIVRLHDVGQFGTSHYLVMEFVEGETLDKLVTKGTSIPAGRAVEYIAQAAAGLQHAYEKGFVHRDIKPANLILAKDGTVKILDMGLARSSEDRDKLTANIDVGAIVGTADYISPEQAVNDPKIDIRADIYSLGATFYSLVTGRPPFTGNTTQKLVQHQMKDAPSLTRMDKTLPKDLAEVVAKMMAKKKEQRFRTPADVISALTPWLPNSGKVVAGLMNTEAGAAGGTSQDTMDQIVASSTKSLTKSLKRAFTNDNKKYYVVGGGVAAVLLVGTLLGWALFGGSPAKKDNPFATAGGTPPPNANPVTPVETPPKAGNARSNPRPAPSSGINEKVAFQLRAADLKPFHAKKKGREFASGTPDEPIPGIRMVAWDAKIEQEWERVNEDGAPAIRFKCLTPGGIASLAFDFEDDKGGLPALVPGKKYRFRVTYKANEPARGNYYLQNFEVRGGRKYEIIPLVATSTWQTSEFTFTRDNVPLKVNFDGEHVSNGGDIFVREAVLTEFGVPAEPPASGKPNSQVYAFSPKDLLGMKFTCEGQDVTSGIKPQFPPTINMHCWKPGSKAEYRGELVDGRPAIRFANRNDPVSAQILVEFEKEGGTTLVEGKEYEIRVTYRTTGSPVGKLTLMTDKFDYLGGVEMPPAEGGWKTVKMPVRREAKPLCCAVNADTPSDDGFISVASVEVIDPEAAKAPPPFFAMSFAGLTPGVRPILATDGQRQGYDVAGVPLPKGVMINQYLKESGGEYSIANVDGTIAFGMRHLEGNGGTQANVAVEDEDKMAVGDAVTIRVVYQYRGNGNPFVAMEEGNPTYKKYNQTTLPPTGAQWKTVDIPFERPAYPQKMTMILNPGKAIHEDRNLSTVWFKSVSIHYPGAATAAGPTPAKPVAKAPPPAPAAPAIGAGQIAFDLKLKDWKPFRFTLEGTKVTAGTRPPFPTGLNLHCWKGTSVAQFAGADQGEGYAFGMTNLNDDASAQFVAQLEFGNDVFLTPGKKYAVRVEYRTTNEGGGNVAIQSDEYVTLSTTPVEATGGLWATKDVPFTRQDGKPIRVAVNSTGVGEGNTLFVRRLTVYEVK